MNRTKFSVGYKIIAYISIIFASLITLATILGVLTKYSSEIYIVGIIITLLACISLLVAGIGALKSIRTGFYLYLNSCIICLIQYIPHVLVRLDFFRQLPQSLSVIIAVIFSVGGVRFWISLFGVIISYYESKKLKRVSPNENGT